MNPPPRAPLRAGRWSAALAAPAPWEATQSVLDPAGIQAARVEQHWWLSFAIAAVVVVVVVAAMLYAVLHRQRAPFGDPFAAEQECAKEHAMLRAVSAAVAVSAVILLGYFLTDLFVGRAIAGVGRDEDHPLTIEVTGHQWWWEIHYDDEIPARRLRTANEIHVPVGRTVELRMTSFDVIHSFWVPNLHGKKDLIPGHLTVTRFRADRPGVFRGQCAEFCGLQHAKMGLLVVAVPPDRFEAWYEGQLAPARAPRDSVEARGQEIFLSHACVTCHAIRGTPAAAHVGPDLTHLASRRMIAAAILPNTRGHLGGWILDPQRIKPGVRMPESRFAAQDLRALLAYLESLE